MYQYSWLGGDTNLTYFNVPFQPQEGTFDFLLIGSVWGPTYVENDMLQISALLTSYIPGQPGYTLRDVNLNSSSFGEIDNLFVPNDSIPTVSLDAVQLFSLSVIGGVVGNMQVFNP